VRGPVAGAPWEKTVKGVGWGCLAAEETFGESGPIL
jgi:hypothetical protein